MDSKLPHALVLDDEAGALGALALRLIRAGVSALHATGRDEAWLLVEQERAGIRALVFPPSLEVADVAAVFARMDAHAQGHSPHAIVIGPRPDDEIRKRLRESGVDTAIWEPYDDGIVRFVVNVAMGLPEEIAARGEPRAPTALTVRIEADAGRREALVYTLSRRGAYLETSEPLAEGAEVPLELPLPGGPVRCPARVVGAVAPGAGSTLPPGMGVVFGELDEPSAHRLGAYVDEKAARFAV